MIGLVVIYLNYTHYHGCAKSEHIESTKNYIDALNKRLLEAESQVF